MTMRCACGRVESHLISTGWGTVCCSACAVEQLIVRNIRARYVRRRRAEVAARLGIDLAYLRSHFAPESGIR